MANKLYTRKFLRIKPDILLYGTLRIVGVGGKKVDSGTARVKILDLSPGGMRFVSSLRLPVDKRVTIEIAFKVEGSVYCLHGFTVHSLSTEVNEFEYGVAFKEPDSYLRESLKKLFAKMSVRLNRHIVILRF